MSDWRDRKFSDGFRHEPIPWNPLRREQIDVLLHLARAHQSVEEAAPRRILDAGCGPGFFAEALLEAFPKATLVGFDLSESMVERARARLGSRAEVHVGDLDAPWPSGPFDLVFAVQSIHHLDDAAKQRALRHARAALAPGGLFLQSDPVAVTDDRFFPLYVELWNRARAGGGFEPLPPQFDRATFDARLAQKGDRLAPLEAHLAWMREAGFSAVDCFWRFGNRAIFGGS